MKSGIIEEVMMLMFKKEMIDKLALEERIIGLADVAYIIAFILMSLKLSVSAVEAAFLLLVIASLGMLVLSALKEVPENTRSFFNIAHIIIGAVIALRYLIYFFTNFTYFCVLVLFVAILGLGYGAAIKLSSFILKKKKSAKSA